MSLAFSLSYLFVVSGGEVYLPATNVSPEFYQKDDPEYLEAKKAFLDCGVEPIVQPIRGGTDGARLSFMGLPCPNLSTGGYNFHGRKELIPLQAMEKMVLVLEKLICGD